MALDLGHEVGADLPDDVDTPRLELGDLGGHLRNGAEDEVLERRLAAPVLIERLQPDVLVALPLHQLPGSGADRRRAANASSPTFSTCFFGTIPK